MLYKRLTKQPTGKYTPDDDQRTYTKAEALVGDDGDEPGEETPTGDVISADGKYLYVAACTGKANRYQISLKSTYPVRRWQDRYTKHQATQ